MSSIFDNETVLKALRRAAWVARHGTREVEQAAPKALRRGSGKFLPPPGWQGYLVTAADAAPKRKRA